MIITYIIYIYHWMVIAIKYDLSKEFAVKLGLMLDSSLIDYKYYVLWCDEIIEYMDEPPYWVIELTSMKYLPEARNIVNRYAYSEPFIGFNYLELNDFYIACNYIKYINKHISWATFLLTAGNYSDGNEGCQPCEYFYSLLNQFEDSEYSKKLERKQSKEVSGFFSKRIIECEKYYNYFLKYFRRYVKRQK